MHMTSGNNMSFKGFLLLSVFLAFFSCTKTDEKTAPVDFKERIHTQMEYKQSGVKPFKIAVAAVISPKETAFYYDEMMKYIGNKLGMPVEIEQRKTYMEINNMLEMRELDLAFVCAGPYVEGKRKFGMELLVAPMLYGKPFYQAYFIVHKDSPVENLRHLRGKSFAFTDPDSNTGKLVPTYVLAEMSERPETFFRETIFTYSHDNSIKAVSKKLVDGASVDGLIWDYYKESNPQFVSNTKIIYRSPLYGIPPVVVHPAIPESFKKNIKEIFLTMHNDPEGREILSRIKIEKFIIPEDANYDSIREMQRKLRKAG